MARSVCIVGAGICGLVSIKTCLEEGLQVDCYDKMDDFGGLWRYRNEDFYGIPSVMKNTIIDTSKEMSALSDFPPDPSYANFMHNSYIIKYFESYVDHFNLRPHIHLEHEILKIDPSENHDVDGSWIVKIKNKHGDIIKKNYDGVMLAVGHHTFPHIPHFSGIESFKGKIDHTHSYKHYEGYEDKNVVVVGIGNSGMDTAIELSRVAKRVYLSTRRGGWVTARVGDNGIPWDIIYSTRFLNFVFSKLLPWSLTNTIFEKAVSKRMDHELYCMKPAHRYLSQHVTVGDDLPNAILAGRIQICGDVDHFTESGIVFKGDDKEYDIEAAVLATGFNFQVPFLDKEIFEVKQNQTELYTMVFPPHLKHPTLAVIGFIQPIGCIFPLAELQARWVTKVFKRELHLPDKEEMLKEIGERRHQLQKTFVQTQRHTVECNFINYATELAEKIGANPNPWTLAFTDPRLFFALVFGPCVPYQFRLQGPHPWKGARKAILKVMDRVKAPLSTRPVEVSSNSFLKIFLTFVAMIFVVMMAVMFHAG